MQFEQIEITDIPRANVGRPRSQTCKGIEAFIESGLEAVEVKGFDKPAVTVYANFRDAIHRHKYAARVAIRGDRVFLVRRGA